MRNNGLLIKDLNEVRSIFPKLKYSTNKDFKILKGEIDIFDSNGVYWDSFTIAVEVPKKYPNAVPQVLELSNNIERIDDRHISKDGVCCIGITHELLFKARKGIRMIDFIKNSVYPYFANQLYFLSHGEYANGEYAHHFNGVKQFYKEKLGLNDIPLIINILELIILNKVPSRNSTCPCGLKKIKHCHNSQIEFLKSIGKPQIKSDLHQFKRHFTLLKKTQNSI